MRKETTPKRNKVKQTVSGISVEEFNKELIKEDLAEMNKETTPIESEEWRDLVDFPNYEVSEYGRVKNKTSGKELKWRICHQGYGHVMLRRDSKNKGMRVHRLVCKAFNGLSDDLQVDHIDGNKLNNHKSNLEGVTPQENIDRAMKLGLANIGSDHGNSKLDDMQVLTVFTWMRSGKPRKEITDHYKITKSHLFTMNHGAWRHLGIQGMLYEKNAKCPECGKQFIKTRINRSFCTRRCAALLGNRINRARRRQSLLLEGLK